VRAIRSRLSGASSLPAKNLDSGDFPQTHGADAIISNLDAGLPFASKQKNFEASRSFERLPEFDAVSHTKDPL
jgi:hypothetical protein